MVLVKNFESTYEHVSYVVEPRTQLISVPKARKKREVTRQQIAKLYDDWSEQRLMNRASVVGVKGWSQMTKEELIEALRQA